MEHGQYRKNDVVTLTIEDIGSDGEGIGKSDGYTLFVKDAVIGDTVEARITKCKKNYGYARVEKVVTPSSFRVEPKCKLHRQCGGCQIQAMDYKRQLVYKQDKVRNNLLRIAGFTEEQIDANTPGGVLRIKGDRLTLLAMTAGELRIGGKIASVEWVGPC